MKYKSSQHETGDLILYVSYGTDVVAITGGLMRGIVLGLDLRLIFLKKGIKTELALAA